MRERQRSRRQFLKEAGIAGAGLVVAVRGLGGAALVRDGWAVIQSPAADPWTCVDVILARINAPVFPARDVPITAHGAVGDGEKDCTAAIRSAIAQCAAAGGGRVMVPKGRFLTGPVHLKSGIDLHVAEGATLAFSTDPRQYLPPVFTRWEGVELMNYSPLIYAFGQQNIAVTGPGTLDGQASEARWWPEGKTRPSAR
jgi:polygalacturonase